jgi:hypothetical protein
MNKLVVSLGKGILIDLLEGNPSEIHRTFESYVSGQILAREDFHNYFKMRVGVFDLCDVTGNRHIQIHFLLYFSGACLFRTFMFADFTTGEFP